MRAAYASAKPPPWNKGDKERLVLLPQPLLDVLGTLWRTHRNPRWLFPNRRRDGPLNQRVLSHTFAARG